MERPETSDEIDDVAAGWAARLDARSLTLEEQGDLELWLAGDIRRRGALARAMAVMEHFDRARALGGGGLPEPRVFGLQRRTFLRVGAVALGATAAAVGGGVWVEAQAQSYQTAKGEIRGIPLADGTQLWLNTDSKVKVKYRSDGRDVALLRGEALFDVAPDPRRPFVVSAMGRTVRAVGTSFSVNRISGDGVEVQVAEGVVDLGSQRPSQVVRLTAGDRAFTGESGRTSVSRLGVDAVGRAQSWRRGLLDFDGVSLAEAAQAFARYSDRRIVIEDPTVARMAVTGLFASSNPAGFARSAALSLNLKARMEPDAIYLTR